MGDGADGAAGLPVSCCPDDHAADNTEADHRGGLAVGAATAGRSHTQLHFVLEDDETKQETHNMTLMTPITLQLYMTDSMTDFTRDSMRDYERLRV